MPSSSERSDTGVPSGVSPVAVATLRRPPASTSAWVSVTDASHVEVAPGARSAPPATRVAASARAPVPSIRSKASVTATPVSDTLPALVTVIA